jgi:hypothetical protein
MSKYNLTDIFEEMSTSEKERFDRLSKDDQDKLEKIMAMVAKEKSMKEDKYDDIVDADDDIPADKKKEAAAAYRKVDKGASYEKATSHIKEVRIDREVAERIEGFLNIPMKAKFLNAFEDLLYDLLDDEPFYVDDVIAHLSNEMHKRVNGNQAAGERLAGIGEGAMQSGEADLEAGEKGTHLAEDDKNVMSVAKSALEGEPHLDMYIKSLKNDIRLNGEEQYNDYSKEDFVEDYNNYVADKSLQEHFGRFMKDYQ